MTGLPLSLMPVYQCACEATAQLNLASFCSQEKKKAKKARKEGHRQDKGREGEGREGKKFRPNEHAGTRRGDMDPGSGTKSGISA